MSGFAPPLGLVPIAIDDKDPLINPAHASRIFGKTKRVKFPFGINSGLISFSVRDLDFCFFKNFSILIASGLDPVILNSAIIFHGRNFEVYVENVLLLCSNNRLLGLSVYPI